MAAYHSDQKKKDGEAQYATIRSHDNKHDDNLDLNFRPCTTVHLERSLHPL